MTGAPWRVGAKLGGWRDRARCRAEAKAGRLDPSVFFPSSQDDPRTEAAKACCAACPVREECLAANMATLDGTYGGMTEWERRSAARRHRAQKAGGW